MGLPSFTPRLLAAASAFLGRLPIRPSSSGRGSGCSARSLIFCYAEELADETQDRYRRAQTAEFKDCDLLLRWRMYDGGVFLLLTDPDSAARASAGRSAQITSPARTSTDGGIVKPGRTSALCSPGLDDQMRREVCLLAAFMLAGCVPDKPKDLAACQTEADRFYSRHLAVDPAAPAARYIIECMAAKGYDFEIEPAACNSRYPLPTQSTCYKSNNWLAGIIDQFRQSQQSD